MIINIALFELKRWFLSSWILLAILQFLLAYSFLSYLENFLNIQNDIAAYPSAPGVTAWVISSTYQTASFLFLLLIPLLTMRVVSEEKKQGSLTLLLSCPIRIIDIIIGKYFGLLLFCFILLLPLAVMGLSLTIGTSLDWGRFISAHLGLFLLISSFAALGLYISTIIHQPIMAAAISFASLLFLWIIDWAGEQIQENSLAYISLLQHYQAWSSGLVYLNDISYFLLFILTFLTLSTLYLINQAKKILFFRDLIFYILFFSIIFLMFSLSIRHDKVFDITNNQINTLSQSSKITLNAFKQPLHIQIFIQQDHQLVPVVNTLLKRYKYLYKNITWEYIDPHLQPEIVEKYNIQAGNAIIFYQENYQKIEFISEQNITQGLQKLLRKKNQSLVFLNGYKDLEQTGEQGYSLLYQHLIQQGIPIKTLNLLKEESISQETSMLILLGAKALFEGELEAIKQYLEKGGKLLWLQDPTKNKNLQRLADYLEIYILPGTVVDNNLEIRDFINIPQHGALIPIVDMGAHSITKTLKSYTLFAFACALDLYQEEKSSWQKASLLLSLDMSWAERDSLSGMVFYDEGDRLGPLDLGVALEKQNTRVVMFCDSDFLNNQYIGSGDNLQLGLNAINWLLGEEELLAIPAKVSLDSSLYLKPWQISLLGLVFLIFLPLLFFITGLFFWWWRRRT